MLTNGTFDADSLIKLEKVDTKLKAVLIAARRFYAFKILEGWRDPARQLMLYNSNPPKTQVRFGTHNSDPATGVDIAPIIDGKTNITDREQLCHLAGFIQGIGMAMSIELRWGNDWNKNNQISEKVAGDKFDDLYHLELV